MFDHPGRLLVLVSAAVFLVVGSSCAPPAVVVEEDREQPREEPAATLVPAVAPVSLADDGDPSSLAEAVSRSLDWLRGVPADRQFDYGIRIVTAASKIDALEGMLAFLETEPTSADLEAWLMDRFDLVEMAGDRPGEVLVTGYFEPVIAGSPIRTAQATVPVYGRPDDLVTVHLQDHRETLPDERIAGRVVDGRLIPYYTRAEIQEGLALESRGLEIAWVEDRVDLFFVEVQGSGAIAFPDGSEMRIGFADTNGHIYRSVGRLLIEEGHVPRERMSMQAVRQWLEANPGEVSRVLNHNASYVFFRELDTPPVGALGVSVVGGRSVATDLRLFPRAALAFLETTYPELDDEGNVVAGAPLNRLVLNHDTGGAIRGPGRVDFFWGRGPDAERRAGLMQQIGRLVVLVPRR